MIKVCIYISYAGYQGDSDGDGIKKRTKGLKIPSKDERDLLTSSNNSSSSKDDIIKLKLRKKMDSEKEGHPETRSTGYASNTDKSEDSGSLRNRKRTKTPPGRKGIYIYI
jgi:hypothetical protein